MSDGIEEGKWDFLGSAGNLICQNAEIPISALFQALPVSVFFSKEVVRSEKSTYICIRF